jgi:1-aminocyclopropane-1-carboxylate deaminase
LIHDKISGNKWRKLKYNLLKVKESGHHTILTFGGAYSNHIHATAFAGKLFNIKTIGIIRGEEHIPLNPTIADAIEYGMKISYVSRSDYRKKKNPEFIDQLRDQFGDFYMIPEGGSNNLAVKGCTEIIDNITVNYDYLVSACGTGGTLSGIICGLKGNKSIIGIPVLKGAQFLYNDIEHFVYSFAKKKFNNWKLNLDFHFGGYAKITKELVSFIDRFEFLNKIKLDPIYTGKLLYSINELSKTGYFNSGSTIIAVHTGGLQGIRGMESKISKLLSA